MVERFAGLISIIIGVFAIAITYGLLYLISILFGMDSTFGYVFGTVSIIILILLPIFVGNTVSNLAIKAGNRDYYRSLDE